VTQGDRKFEDVKAEMDRLSGILIKKEFEIDTAKKDALSAKEEMLALQTKLASVQDNLYSSRVNQEKLKELENQRLTMQSQLNQVQQELLKKNELLESLQKNIDYLTMQVEKKDQEKAALDAKLSLLDSSTRNELDKEKKRSEESNQMYSSLKSQISQFSDAIALKEAEIENKRKDISSLREELSALKFRSAQLENDLLESKESQKKLMGDLSAAVRLNSVLQERIRFAPAGQESVNFGSSPEDKKKADELKKKIEVILEPEKQ
jgi:chromosome segregation ATPase